MEDEKETQIPVFTVWKNNAILKNIFLINAPPPVINPGETQLQIDENSKIHKQINEICKTQKQFDENCETQKRFEETVVVGRHPDCDIRLQHPSISRFHLRIHSNPSTKQLFLTDLSSVHGTFVSGRRMEPNVRTTLNESDTLRIGGSSRVYKLHWIPLSQAYDVSNPFVPPLDLASQEDEDEEIIKDECSLELENEVIQAVESVSKGLESGVLCGDDKVVVEQVARKTEEKVLAAENVCVESKYPDLEDLMSLCLDENSLVFAQEEMPPDPPGQKLNSEVVTNGKSEPLDSALEGLDSLFWGEIFEWVGQEENYMICPTEEEYPHLLKHVGMGTIDSTSEDLDAYNNSELDVQKVIPSEDLDALEGLVSLFWGEIFEPVGQEENYMTCPTEEDYPHSLKHEGMGTIDSTSEDLDVYNNSELDVQKVIPSVPPMLECISVHMTPNLDNPTVEESSGMVSDLIQNEEQASLLKEDSQVSEGLDVSSAPSMLEDMAVHMTPNLDIPIPGESSSGMTSEVIQNEEQISLPEEDNRVLKNLETFEYCELDVQKVIPSVPSMRGEILFEVAPHLDNPTAGEQSSGMMSRLIQNEQQISQPEEDIQGGVWNFWSGSLVAPASIATENNQLPEFEPEVLSETQCSGSVNVYQNSPIKDHNRRKPWSFWSGSMGVESSVCSSLSDTEFILESENITSGTSVQSPPLSSIKRPFGNPVITSDEKSASCICSRRGKLQSAPQILTSRSEGKRVKSDKNNCKPDPLSRALFNDADVQEAEEVEIFTPGKENFTPNTHRSIRKLAMLKDMKNLSSGKSPLLKMTGSPNVYYEDSITFSSDKENCSPRTFLQQKTARRASVDQGKSIRLRERNREEILPFQSLLAKLPQNSAPKTCLPDPAMTKEKFTSKRIQSCSMIVDTTTLLNKESRKAFKLLEGLKGTQLIIPKIVIKDLACLKRQTSFFRRNREVSSALDWIEDCMVKTQRWVHVQNSMEEGRPVAPTPPGSPYSQASCGTTAGLFILASVFETQPELLLPTVEDHIVDYALNFRKKKNDGQLVLLSNDVTLKIKAMAEGIICETAEEFRESLVNPFSERFLWVDSSPRGQTWSCSDDFVLRKKFYPSSLKMTPKAIENVKGLKLILPHNSQNFEQMTAIH